MVATAAAVEACREVDLACRMKVAGLSMDSLHAPFQCHSWIDCVAASWLVEVDRVDAALAAEAWKEDEWTSVEVCSLCSCWDFASSSEEISMMPWDPRATAMELDLPVIVAVGVRAAQKQCSVVHSKEDTDHRCSRSCSRVGSYLRLPEACSMELDYCFEYDTLVFRRTCRSVAQTSVLLCSDVDAGTPIEFCCIIVLF